MMFTKQDYLSIAKIITETDWCNESFVTKNSFHVSQFQGTIFMSDYQCFKIERNSDIMVAKDTIKAEYSILKLLKKDDFPVPAPIEYLVNQVDQRKILLFEQFMCGSELSPDSPKELWREAAIQLGKLHLKYWGAAKDALDFQHGSILYLQKWHNVTHNHYFSQKWEKIVQKIVSRFSNVPYTVGHGDAFPTNFLVHEGRVSFVDMANVGVIPYMADIARLTCLPALNDEKLLCPYREDVLDTYYEVIRECLKVSREEFLFDVKLASFIELAVIYTPPVGINVYSFSYKCKENKILEKMLCCLADELI